MCLTFSPCLKVGCLFLSQFPAGSTRHVKAEAKKKEQEAEVRALSRGRRMLSSKLHVARGRANNGYQNMRQQSPATLTLSSILKEEKARIAAKQEAARMRRKRDEDGLCDRFPQVYMTYKYHMYARTYYIYIYTYYVCEHTCPLCVLPLT